MTIKEDARNERWLYPTLILLGAFLIFKLVNQSQVILQFPLDQNNDISAHLGQLHFLRQYGFHNNVPNWFNGYTLFLNYPIGWYFLTLPLYIAFGNILLATFVSHILLLIVSFILFLALGRIAKLSLTKTVFFYLVFFANPVAVGNFIKLGRVTELTGMLFFIILFVILLYFKEKKFNFKGMLLLSLAYSALIFSHPSWTIFASLLLPAFFILQNRKGRLYLTLSLILSFLATSFWLFPFLLTAGNSMLGIFNGTQRLLDFKVFLYDNLVSFALPPFMWLTAFFYFKNIRRTNRKQLKREIVFYSIQIIISILYITRLILFIPIIKRPYPDSYHMLFIFFSILFLVKTPLASYHKLWNKMIKLFLMILPFLFILLSVLTISNFRVNNTIDKEIISLLPNVGMNDKFLIENMPYPTSSDAFYSYAAIYYNLSTPSGWLDQGAGEEYHKKVGSVRQYIQEKDCENILKSLRNVNATKLIIYKDYCQGMRDCDMNLLIQKENVCLLGIPKT